MGSNIREPFITYHATSDLTDHLFSSFIVDMVLNVAHELSNLYAILLTV